MIALRPLIRVAAVAVSSAWVGAGMPTVFADDSKPTTAAAKPEAKPKKAPAEYRGPLPFYYGKVVSPDQKEKIYSIQRKYDADIGPLLAKIKELQAARDQEIDAILSPEQLKRIEEIRAEARNKSKAAAAKTAPSEGAKPEAK